MIVQTQAFLNVFPVYSRTTNNDWLMVYLNFIASNKNYFIWIYNKTIWESPSSFTTSEFSRV